MHSIYAIIWILLEILKPERKIFFLETPAAHFQMTTIILKKLYEIPTRSGNKGMCPRARATLDY